MACHVEENIFVFIQFLIVLKDSSADAFEYAAVNEIDKWSRKGRWDAGVTFHDIAVIHDERIVRLKRGYRAHLKDIDFTVFYRKFDIEIFAKERLHLIWNADQLFDLILWQKIFPAFEITDLISEIVVVGSRIDFGRYDAFSKASSDGYNALI